MKRWTVMLAVALMAFLLSGVFSSADARGKVFIKVGPPSHRVVVVKTASPFQHGVWASGHWAWRGGRHVWVDGYWMKPKPGHFWVDGRWVHTRHGWEWIPGHWRR